MFLELLSTLRTRCVHDHPMPRDLADVVLAGDFDNVVGGAKELQASQQVKVG